MKKLQHDTARPDRLGGQDDLRDDPTCDMYERLEKFWNRLQNEARERSASYEYDAGLERAEDLLLEHFPELNKDENPRVVL